MEFIIKLKTFECLLTKKRSHYLLDVLPHTLTLDPNFVGIRGREFTLFKEVRVVPFRETITKEIQELFTTKIGTIKMSKSQFFSSLRQKLENAIESYWKPELNHIHFCSSGLDSRIISWTIRSLFRKYGPDWLGRMIFLCCKWEAPSFKKIMKYEGWKNNQYFATGERIKDEDFWAPILLDFKNAWRRAQNDFTRATNMLTYFPEVAHEKLHFPLDNIQVLHGDGHGLISSTSGAEMRNFYEVHYPLPCGHVPSEWQIISPYYSLDLLKYILQSSIQLGKQLRPELLIAMDKNLARFPNLNKQSHTPHRHSKFVLKKALQDYQKSWYGRKVRPNAVWPAKPKYESMISTWTIASLCEHLLTNGYKIEIGTRA